MSLPVAERWFRAEVIAADITRYEEPYVDELLRANFWRISGSERDLIVDCGLGVGDLRGELPELFARDPVVVLTHGHLDHMGGAHQFADVRAHAAEPIADPPPGSLLGPPLAIELGLEEELAATLIVALPHDSYDPAAYRLEPVTVTRSLIDGDRIELGSRGFTVLHLPGHSPGQIALYDEVDGSLFSGDVIYDDELLDAIHGADRAAYRASLRRLRTLAVSTVYPGHGEPFGRRRLHELIDAYLASTAPAATGARLLPESAPQDRVWMAFPPQGSTITATPAEAEEAWQAWSAVAHALTAFQPVTMVVSPAERSVARRMLSAEIEIVEALLDDAWIRDSGPSFTVTDSGALGAVDWVFNGWGAQEWARWEHDARLAATVAAHAGAERVCSPLVNEGGGMVYDGRDTLFLTRTVQLDPSRNPTLDAAAVEAELRRTLGIDRFVWLPRGLTRDMQRFGTRGHADMMIACPAPGRLLAHVQRNPEHPDHTISTELLSLLANGPWEVIELPAPQVLRDADGWVDFNYVNHVAVNGGVVACAFADPADAEAREILAAAYPGREVVSVDARPIFARGGGIHCITLQQPRVAARDAPEEER